MPDAPRKTASPPPCWRSATITADKTALEGKDGWAQAVSRAVNWKEVTEGLGTRYEAALNTYKPFACGIVSHPGIDAAIQLRNENKLTPGQIDTVELHANPLVLSLMGKTDPQTGLEGKFSIYHCIAVGLIYGAAGERQFQDEVVRDPAVVAVRKRVTVRTDAAVMPQKSDLTVKLKDGRVLIKHIENAIGSVENPMSDCGAGGEVQGSGPGHIARRPGREADRIVLGRGKTGRHGVRGEGRFRDLRRAAQRTQNGPI